MKKLLVVGGILALGLIANLSYADGWHGREWRREGWRGGWGGAALGAVGAGGLIGGIMLERAALYGAARGEGVRIFV